MDKVSTEVLKTFHNAGGKPTRGFSLIIQHKTFSALNCTQDFGNRVKESLKRNTNSNSWKVELSHVKYFHAFVSTQHVSPIGANKDKRRWSWDGGGLDRELSTSVFDNELKKRIISGQSGIFTTNVMGLCHAICYIFTKLKLFLHQLNSKIMVLFCYLRLFWHWYCFPSSVVMDCNWLKLRPTTRYRTHTVISTR